ncbi:MAG: phenylacetic acid degradation protein PaaN [Chitinophagales bacterium]|nr:phenylacetic acid degradation protein PaaN [Chitinophagales bacterium]
MSLFEKHKLLVDNAIRAIHDRGYYAAYAELPKAYPEDSLAKASGGYNNYLSNKFELPAQGAPLGWAGEEVSPYTQEPLDVRYPIYKTDDVIERAGTAFYSWRKTTPAERTGLLIESLDKIKEHFFEIALATQHTTGQSWIMSFQASGPHAADRALETIALGYYEQTRFPEKVLWEKPTGKFSVKLEKEFRPQPRGIGVVVGCSTFPVWNSLPGLFANLVSGNAAIVKPHPKSILPIAICVAAIQQTFMESGYDPCTVQLAADTTSHQNTKELVLHPDVKLIDYTGSTDFGNYIESLPGKISFTEKAGVNSVIIDSVANLDPVLQNLAFSVSLYSGQMCTAPQNFFIPDKVIEGDQTIAFDEVVGRMKDQLNLLVNNPKMGAGVLGAVQNEITLARIENAEALGGRLLLSSSAVRNEEFANSRTVSPVLMEAEASENHIFESELFGPIAIAIRTRDTDESIKLAKELASEHGAITCAAYTTDENMMRKISEEMNEVFTPVTFNLTGPIWVNQHAAFSDFHVTGGNSAGNASLTNPEFVIKRFVWVGNRRMI